MKESFCKEVEIARKLGAKKFIISNEHCHSRLTADRMVKRLLDLFQDRFDDIQILLFLRPQADLLVSRLSNKGRRGKIRPEDLDISPCDDYYNFLKIYKSWNSIFLGCVRIVPYKSVGNVVEWTEDYLCLKGEKLIHQERSNEAIDYRVASLAHNMELPRLIGDTPNPNPEFFMDKLWVEEKITISQQEAVEVQRRFEENNLELCRICSDITLQELSPDLSKYPVKGNFQDIFHTIHFQPFLGAIVDLYQVEIWFEKVATKCAEAEREIERGNFSKALEYINIGEKYLTDAKQIDTGNKCDVIGEFEKRIEIVHQTIGKSTIWRRFGSKLRL